MVPAGESGTTAVFYDYVRHVATDLYGRGPRPTTCPRTGHRWRYRLTPCPRWGGAGRLRVTDGVGQAGGLWSIGFESNAFARGAVDVARVRQGWDDGLPTPLAITTGLALESNPTRGSIPRPSPARRATRSSPTGYAVVPPGAGLNAEKRANLAALLRYAACPGQRYAADYGYAPIPQRWRSRSPTPSAACSARPPSSCRSTTAPTPLLEPRTPARSAGLDAGGDRIDTAIRVAKQAFLGGDRAEAGHPRPGRRLHRRPGRHALAASLNALLLVNPGTASDPRVLDEIRRLMRPGGQVHVLGGASALDRTSRRSSPTPSTSSSAAMVAIRYATSVAIAEAIGRRGSRRPTAAWKSSPTPRAPGAAGQPRAICN